MALSKSLACKPDLLPVICIWFEALEHFSSNWTAYMENFVDINYGKLLRNFIQHPKNIFLTSRQSGTKCIKTRNSKSEMN